MTSKVRAGRRGWEIEPASAERAAERVDPYGSESAARTSSDPEVEAEAAAVAAWFAALPAALRAYLDREARHGTEAYRRP